MSNERVSKTGIALINLLVEDAEVYDFRFSGNIVNSNADNRDIVVGIGETDSGIYNEFSNPLIQAQIIHELAHLYTDTQWYNSKLLPECGNEQLESVLTNKYKEATAITVENQFLFEMGYNPRNVEKYGGIGKSKDSYGSWPLDWSEIYIGEDYGDNLGVSLIQTHYIWYDIQRNYWR